MKANKLYTVNESNKGMFVKANKFDWGGLAEADKHNNPWNYADDLDTVKQYQNSTNVLGISKMNNPFSKGVMSQGIGAMAKTPIGGAVIGQLGSAVGKAGGALIGGGLQSKAGSAISNIGGSIGSAISTVNPLIGGIVSVGSGLVGGVVNRAFGTKVDQAKLDAANAGTQALNNYTSNASNFDDIKSIEGQANVQNAYKGGWFSSGSAARKNAELLNQRIDAQQMAERGLLNNIHNIAEDQYNNALANYAAFGGLINTGSPTMNTSYVSPFKSMYNFNQASSLGDFSLPQIPLPSDNYNLEEQEFAPANYGYGETNNPNYNLVSVVDMGGNSKQSQNTVPNFSYNSSSAGASHKYNKNNANYVKKALQKSGKFNSVQIEGILQNIARESGFNANSTGDRGAAYGLLQWHGNRRPSDLSLKGQTQFLIDTLSHYDGGKHWIGKDAYNGFLHAKTPEEAHYYIAKGYERPANNILYGLKKQAYMSLGRKKALGGIIQTHGSDFSNGLMSINAGGTHENNPLGGVPMGIDAQGVPNLVEEGETVYNNYVYSRRLKVPKKLYKDLGLSGIGKKGISFAEASKKLAEESEQRPNDPISEAGLKESMLRLSTAQEGVKMLKAPKSVEEDNTEGNKFYDGGHKINLYGYDPINTFKYFHNGKYDDDYLDFINNRLDNDWINRAMSGVYGDMSRYKGSNNFNPTLSQARTLGQDKKYSDWHKAMANAFDEYKAGINPVTGLPNSVLPNPTIPVGPIPNLHVNAPVINHNISNDKEEGIPQYDTRLRYAPALGAGIMTLTDTLGLTNKPDYTYANKLEAAATKASYAPNIGYNPIGDYLTYRPMDINYEQNKMDANARATDRAIANSGLSASAKMAGLIATGYNNQNADGQLYRNALEYNDAKRERVTGFNRETNSINSQMALQAAMANARYRQSATQFGLSGLAQAAALRDSIDQRVGASRSANISNLLNSLGNIGRENFEFNVLNNMKSSRYGLTKNGGIKYKK